MLGYVIEPSDWINHTAFHHLWLYVIWYKSIKMKMKDIHQYYLTIIYKYSVNWQLINTLDLVFQRNKKEIGPIASPWNSLYSGSLLFPNQIDAISSSCFGLWSPLAHRLPLEFLFNTNFHHGFFPTLFFQQVKGFDSSRFISKQFKERPPEVV